MKVVLARHAGACYGVQRALDMADGVIEQDRCAHTLGPLIHNPLVVHDLEQRGVSVVDSVDAVSEGAIIIRSHGVTPAVLSQARERGLDVVDATCPHVARAQAAAAALARKGCRVVVVGEAGHPEVEGLCAWASDAGAQVDVAVYPEDLPETLEGPVGVVVQTTQTREHLDAIVNELCSRGLDPEVKNTICSATRQRQKTAAEVAQSVDAMVVIGGRNSSNTTRLAEICSEACPHTIHIESVDELSLEFFAQCETVGVTAGASTPENQIKAVVSYLESMDA